MVYRDAQDGDVYAWWNSAFIRDFPGIFWQERFRHILICLLTLFGSASAVYSAELDTGEIVTPLDTVVVRRRTEPDQDLWSRPSTKSLKGGDFVRAVGTNQARIRIYPGFYREGRIVSAEEIGLWPNATIRVPERRGWIKLISGLFHFHHRTGADVVSWETESVVGAAEKTDYMVKVMTNGEVLVRVALGEVQLYTNKANLTNAFTLMDQQAARYNPKAKEFKRLSYWDIRVRGMARAFLYYPGILFLGDLDSNLMGTDVLTNSVLAYSVGNLPVAFGAYPTNRMPASNAERLYLASLVLTVGDFQKALSLVTNLSLTETNSRVHLGIAGAIEKIIAAAEGQSWTNSNPPGSATEWLAESYYQQLRAREPDVNEAWEGDVYRLARSPLERALIASMKAAPDRSTNGFGWVRRAELEFSFGRIPSALNALAQSGGHQDANAQAVALRGFLSWAENDYESALGHFRKASELDWRLGNAWIGLGLTKLRQENAFEYFRRGQPFGYWKAQPDSPGLKLLESAVASEPERSLIRSYLGKAYYDSAGLWGQSAQLKSNALEQVELAKRLDTNDPTPYLYSALILQQENRINEAVQDLQRSVEKNDNRQIYRSGFLLDQDRAVRSANLASIYRDAGMAEVSLNEAVKAVNTDYANYSAHLFLANSYNELRDPKQVNLRYETPWLSEYLVANLLAPVDASILSPAVSQGEYSRLFQRDHLGVRSYTEYLSSGEWRQTAAQYGVIERTSYSLESYYLNQNGQRPNNDLEAWNLSARIKQQITPEDSFYLEISRFDYESGDVAQYLDPAQAQNSLRVTESQEPILSLGYHHQWSPGSHTLLLATRADDTLTFANEEHSLLLLELASDGGVIKSPRRAAQPPFDVPTIPRAPFEYRSEFTLYSFELQQIFQQHKNSLIIGGRYQRGSFDVDSSLEQSQEVKLTFNLKTTNIAQSISSDLDRVNFYAYDQWRVFEPFTLAGGISFDRLAWPENYRNPPLAQGARTESQVSPKIGFIWTPLGQTTLRAGYTRSLGGVSFDQSFRLEPTQVAGFNQAFRSLVGESVAGSLAGVHFETWGAALEQKIGARAFLTLEGQVLESDAEQEVGLFVKPQFVLGGDNQQRISTETQVINYRERNLTATINYLADREWSLGFQYRLTDSDFKAVFPIIPESEAVLYNNQGNALLQQVNLFVHFNHSSGVFGNAQALWTDQDLAGDAGDHFWHFNIHGGYRFLRRRIELRIGLLNLMDQDYRLHPYTPYLELPRERTFITSCRFNF